MKDLFNLIREYGFREAFQRVLLHFNLLNAIRHRDSRLRFSCDIRQGLPSSTHLGHPVGIVIASSAEIGENVQINQNVTIGAGRDGSPTIKDDAVIYSGAVVIGDITVGERAVIGANSVVLQDVESETVVAGVPATEIDSDIKGPVFVDGNYDNEVF